jgi:hypothetical protein
MGEGDIPSAASPLNSQLGLGRGYQAAGETRPDGADDWDADFARQGTRMLTGPLPPESDHDESADKGFTGRTVVAEWALWGKEARDLEYRLLRCSKGTFRPSDFDGIITRYSPGTKETLPQYTVCWVPDENGHEGYLAVAIHEAAGSDPQRSGGRVQAAGGREIEYIRLFCVRYSEMAKYQVGYAELVESVMSHQLPDGPVSPIAVELLETEVPSFPAPVSLLAENVATLLLNVRPVCVLGAERTTAEDRLRFIDQVMSLLPYGLRATMSASTWASATAKNLKLRLFFASAERDDGGTTAHVAWGRPVRFDFSTQDNTPLRHYVNWLGHGGAAAPELGLQTDVVRFDPAEIRAMIANLPSDRPVKDTLEELADGLRHDQLPVVRAAVKRLRRRLTRVRSLDERTKYRQEIKRLGLFKDHEGLPPRTAASIYRVLLELAYGPRLPYASYCEIEDYVGAPPGGALGLEILKLGFNSCLTWLLASKSATDLTDQELMKSLQQQGIEATGPITEFSTHTDAVRVAHRQVGYDFSIRYLRAYAADPRAELKQRGYLTHTLETAFPYDQRAQRNRLKEMLIFVYGGMLSADQSAELCGQPEVRRTAAFEEVVAELTIQPRPGRRQGPRTLWADLRAFAARVRNAQLTLRGTVAVIALAVIVSVVIGIFIGLLVHSLHA